MEKDEGQQKSFVQGVLNNMRERTPLPKPHEEVLTRDADEKRELENVVRWLEDRMFTSVFQGFSKPPEHTVWRDYVGVLDDGTIDIGCSFHNRHGERVEPSDAQKKLLHELVSRAPEGAITAKKGHGIHLRIDPEKLQDAYLKGLAALHIQACRALTKGEEVEGVERQFFARLMTEFGLGSLQQKEAYREPRVIPPKGHKGNILVSFQVSPEYKEKVLSALYKALGNDDTSHFKGIEIDEGKDGQVALWVDNEVLQDDTLKVLGEKLVESCDKMHAQRKELYQREARYRRWDALSGEKDQQGVQRFL